MIFQQIRSATIKIKYDSTTFLIDPWLSDIASIEEIEKAKMDKKFISKPMVNLPFSVKDILSDMDVCLVSHDHEDHFSPDYLPKDMKLIFQNQKDEEYGKSLGFVNTSYFHKDDIRINDITIVRTPGKHGDNDLCAQKMGPVSGFLFMKDHEKTIWVAGDTVFYDGLIPIIETYHPDIIVVNACDARTRSGRLIMNAEDVIKMCEISDAIIIASHMDTVSHAHLTRKQLRKQIENTPYVHRIRIPEDGERIEF